MQRERLTLVLITLWGITFSKVIQAAAVYEFIGGYDSGIIIWSACTAMLGGLLRTIISLQSDRRIIREILVEGVWDLSKSLISGLVVFFAFQALKSLGWQIPNEVRFGGVLAAGVFRFTALNWLMAWALQWINVRGEQILGKPLDSKKKDE